MPTINAHDSNASVRDDQRANVKSKTLEHAVSVVQGVIHDWRPLGFGEDEWQREIRAIAKQVARIASARDAAHAIARVFSAALSGDTGFSPEACQGVGERLFRALVSARLVADVGGALRERLDRGHGGVRRA